MTCASKMRANLHIFILYVCCFVMSTAKDEKNISVFVPTREWQTVKKGTPIPQGLHIRHNFQTGVTEAKLMDPDEKAENVSKTSTSLSVHPDESTRQADTSGDVMKDWDRIKLSTQELKARLKKIKLDQAEISSDLNEEESQADPSTKFKSYAELKKDLKELELNVTTDSELLVGYIERFDRHKGALVNGELSSSDVEDVLDTLNNLEYLLHQIDNAQMFSKMEGMTKIVSPCLNTTNNEIKAEALRLLGAAAQSNPKVQAKALESELIQKILHVLVTSNKDTVRSRSLFALGALIRHFPAAQKAFIDHGGVEIFGKILASDHPLQIQSRVMKLISDLAVERQNINDIHEKEQRQQRSSVYEVTGFERKLIQHEYCKHLSDLTTRSLRREIDNKFNSDDIDFLETIFENTITISSVCKSQFRKDRHALLPVINKVLILYHDSTIEFSAEDDDSFRNLILSIEKFKQNVFNSETHDEL